MTASPGTFSVPGIDADVGSVVIDVYYIVPLVLISSNNQITTLMGISHVFLVWRLHTKRESLHNSHYGKWEAPFHCLMRHRGLNEYEYRDWENNLLGLRTKRTFIRTYSFSSKFIARSFLIHETAASYCLGNTLNQNILISRLSDNPRFHSFKWTRSVWKHNCFLFF